MTDFLILLAILSTVVAAVVWSDRHVPRDFLASLLPEADDRNPYMAAWSDRAPGELPERRQP